MTTAIVLTPLQKDIIVGTLLGDACAERKKMTHNTRLRFEQSYPAHNDYLLSIYEALKSLTKAGPGVVTRKADKRTGLVYLSIAFKTRALSILNPYYDLFYVDNKKQVPSNIQEYLTPAVLAY